jgi:hypothetical protein
VALASMYSSFAYLSSMSLLFYNLYLLISLFSISTPSPLLLRFSRSLYNAVILPSKYNGSVHLFFSYAQVQRDVFEFNTTNAEITEGSAVIHGDKCDRKLSKANDNLCVCGF